MFIHEYGSSDNPKAQLAIRPGYAHCGYMAAEPKAYVEQIEAFLERIER